MLAGHLPGLHKQRDKMTSLSEQEIQTAFSAARNAPQAPLGHPSTLESAGSEEMGYYL